MQNLMKYFNARILFCFNAKIMFSLFSPFVFESSSDIISFNISHNATKIAYLSSLKIELDWSWSVGFLLTDFQLLLGVKKSLSDNN